MLEWTDLQLQTPNICRRLDEWSWFLRITAFPEARAGYFVALLLTNRFRFVTALRLTSDLYYVLVVIHVTYLILTFEDCA